MWFTPVWLQPHGTRGSIHHKQSRGVSLSKNTAKGGGNDNTQDHTADNDHDLLLLRCCSTGREKRERGP